MEELLTKEIGKLAKKNSNLKKVPNKRYRRETLVGKLDLAKNIYNEL